MANPSFSIVVPTFQRRDTVCDCVRALSEVAYDGDVELIAVIDGSTDGTEDALRAIALPFPVKIVAQPNAGLAAARNRGAAEAAKDIILFLDDDMMARPDILHQHAASHADGAAVVLGHIPLDPKSPRNFLSQAAGNWAEQRAARLAGNEPNLFDLVSGHLSIRRDLFEKTGGYDSRFTDGGTYGDEDLDFGVRLLAEGHSLRFNPEAIASQRHVVTPRRNLFQWQEAARSDVRFARKHPDRADEIFRLHGRDRWTTRFLLRPLAATPAVPDAIAAAASALADREAHLPRWSRRPIATFFAAARDLLYWRGVRRAGGIPSADRALVLCYHAIADLRGDPILSQYGIEPHAFAAQLDSLISRGFTFISPNEFALLAMGKAQVPNRAALVTFDDCYEELTEVARNILQPRDIEAIAFAVSGMGSGTNEWDQRIGARELRLLDGDGLQELARRGVEVGCHSNTHRPMTSVPPGELTAETKSASKLLAAMGVAPPRFFAYPHGANDAPARAAVKDAGFIAAFGLDPTFASPQTDKFAVPRIEILARDTGWRFWVKTRCPRLAVLIHPDPIAVRARRRIGRELHRIRAARAGQADQAGKKRR